MFGSSILTSVDRRIRGLAHRVNAVERFTERDQAADRRRRINREIEGLITAGKVSRAQVDAGLLDYLHDLPTEPVAKFSDRRGLHTVASPLDAALAKLRAGPAIFKYGETAATEDTAATTPKTRREWAEGICREHGDALRKAKFDTKAFREMAEQASDQQFADMKRQWAEVTGEAA